LKKILITGGTGKLGKELKKVFPEGFAPKSSELDITKRDEVENFLPSFKPTIIIHTAALTDVKRCEEQREIAYETNVVGTKNLLDCCDINCYFVQISTACVFHGDKGGYIETDLPYPKNYYSLTKLLAEEKVSRRHDSLIIRTNFVAKEKWSYEKAFTDRYGTYLFAEDVAKAIKEVISDKMTGIVHICGDKKMSMFALAKITTPNIKPLTMSEYNMMINYNGPLLTGDMSLDTIRIRKYKISR
jgi:dTDP-4-dehydrorhamnose reductase